jgi:hypothetical protein
MSQINSQLSMGGQQNESLPPLAQSFRVPRTATQHCEHSLTQVVGESSNSLSSNDSTTTRYQNQIITSRTVIQERQQSFYTDSSEDRISDSSADESDEEVVQPLQKTQTELRKEIVKIQSDPILSSAEKARKIQVHLNNAGFDDQTMAATARTEVRPKDNQFYLQKGDRFFIGE